MSDLINIGLSATRAYGASLRMVGENIASADDPAYVRRRVLLTEATMPTTGNPLYKTQIMTNGVEIAGVGRAVDPLVDAALRRAEATRSESGQRADWLARLEGAIGDGEYSVGARMTGFFAAGARAVATPGDSALRIDILNELARVGEGFAQTAQRIDALDADLDSSMASAVETLNSRMATLASVNRDLRAARPGSAAQAQLFDRRDAAIRDISAMVPTTITTDRLGVATLSVGGVDIVAGITAETLSAARTPGGGVTLSTSAAVAVPFSGGAFAGMDSAGQALRQRRADLDTQAVQFVADVNAWNSAGATPSGGAGAALLTGSDAMTVALATTDPAAIAAATPGGNPAGNLLALDGLRGDAGGEARWRLFAHEAALDLRNARADADAASVSADAALALRDRVSGVDLDQEAAEMLRLQQAYGAAARVLQVARDTVQTILDIL
jgi:flagellar hook-associated protein 1 FlgK